MEKVAREANAGTPKLGIFRVVNEFLEEHAGPKIETFRNKMEIKRWVLTKASEEWKTKVTSSTTLARTYRHSTSLALKGYLKRTYPGRQILTRLRIDDLNLGAAGYRGRTEQKDMCTMCGDEAETREHFALRCKALSEAREANKQAMDLTRNSTQDTALDVLILATPPGAADDIERAIKVGRLVHDLWTLRAKILGIRMTLD